MSAEQLLNVKFVQCVETYSILWDPKSKGYRNKKLIRKGWMEISRQTKEPVEGCRERWRNIRNAFLRSMKKNMNGNRMRKEYYLKPYLTFLMPYVKVSNNSEDPNASATDDKEWNYSFKDEISSNYSFSYSNDSCLGQNQTCSEEVNSKFSDTEQNCSKNSKNDNTNSKNTAKDECNSNLLLTDKLVLNRAKYTKKKGFNRSGIDLMCSKHIDKNETIINQSSTNNLNSIHLKRTDLNNCNRDDIGSSYSSTLDSWNSEQEIEDVFKKLVTSATLVGNTSEITSNTNEKVTNEIVAKSAKKDKIHYTQTHTDAYRKKSIEIDEDIKPGPFLEQIQSDNDTKPTHQKNIRPNSTSSENHSIKSHHTDFQEDYVFFDTFDEAETFKRQKLHEEEENDSDLIFFKSLLRDCRKMSDKQNRKFRLRVLQVVDEIFDSTSAENSQDLNNETKIKGQNI